MRQLLICSSLILSLMTGCTGPVHPKNHDGAILIEQDPSAIELRFWKRSWGGIVGPHGYVGYTTVSYIAALQGTGPTFANPPFLDNPPDFRCIGTITLDREHGRVAVNMRRIVTKPYKGKTT